jgi:hypothetical protein
VGYHEEVVPGPYHPREPDEECRIHAQNCTRNRNVSNYRIYVETANLRHGNPHYVPPVILPDIISGGLLVSATLCKFKQDERFRLSEGWHLEIKACAATNYTTSCPIWTSVILQPHAAPSDHLFFERFSTNQPPTTSQQYFSLRTNQHQPPGKRTGCIPLHQKAGQQYVYFFVLLDDSM